MPLPKQVYIPLQQHIGAPCEPLVKKGDTVKTGQVIGRSSAYVSAPVHASITGVVKAVDKFFHPLGMRVEMVHIERTGDEDDWELLSIPENWEKAPRVELIKLINDAGIVGMGGAAFPTHVKLNPPTDKKIDSFILNGVECEPYLTSDHRLMVEHTDQILAGMNIIMSILNVENGYIGIENNKPDAIEMMSKRVKELGYSFLVVPLEVKYPQGAEKMLIESVLRRRVPAGGLPMDVGVVVNNVATAKAVADAVLEGKSLVERVTTVTGDGIVNPKNLLTRIGTPFNDLVEFCGGAKDETTMVFMGGPMMGQAQYDLSVPVIKATGGIVCNTSKMITMVKHFPCIHCGACVDACPMYLLPTQLAKLTEHKKYEEAEKLGIQNCIECGSCAFSCPAHIPLVQWLRVGKMRVSELKHKQKAS
ncbi:MAG: H+/Na+-translocating ferredoxin:NAD+ oxidoreductase subunit [Candidatus Marinimicrobia bacterium]|nr:H+/Na+-translocating ferredoxin:NAD+ oxidoreductase subunit [Candidatus Neomarinimicrobiota bacterium]